MLKETGSVAPGYELTDNVLSRQVGTESVIIDLNSETYFGLDEVGSVLWTGLEERLPIDAIVARVVDRYDVSRERAEADLTVLVDELQRVGLIRRCG